MPMHLHVLIAQAGPLTPSSLPETGSAPPAMADKSTMIVLAAAILIAAVAFFWAFFLRKRPKHSRGTIGADRRSGSSHGFGSSGRRRRRKRRDSHPENLPRNPTLSETGGLPPPRPEEPGSSPQSRSPQTS